MTEKRFILLLFGIFFSVAPSWSQKINTESITWRTPSRIYNESGVLINVLSFDGASYNSSNSYLPTLTISINNAEGVTFSINNPVFTPLTEQELNLIGSTQIPSNYGITVSTGIASKVPVSIVSLVPIAYNSSSGGYEKLVSFQYTYQVVSLRKAAVTALPTYAAHSVLSSGNWYKLSIPSTGVFKIDYTFLQGMGIDPSTVDPTTIRVFGNGGGMLPQPNGTSRPDDLLENPIYVYGANDGKFDNTDYALFYGTGPDTWTYNSNGTYTHTKNLYSDSTFYFFTYGGASGIRVSPVPTLTSGSTNSLTTYTEYALHENELVNLLHSGRYWYGETFSEATQSYSLNYTFDGMVQGATTNKITASVVASLVTTSQGSAQTEFEVSANGTTSFISIPSIGSGQQGYQNVGTQVSRTFSFNSTANNGIAINIIYNLEGNTGAIGYLDYLELNFQRVIGLYGNQTNFRCVPQSSTSSIFTVADIPDTSVSIWDVTNPLNPQNQAYSFSSNQATFAANTSTAKEYVVFQGKAVSNPSFIGKISTQDLHGISTFPTLAIITTSAFANEATKFQNLKQQQGILTSVYYLEEIYNEFSSGAQDITAIRDFMRMLYIKSNNLKYLLLFGDCSYDYKNRVSNNTNFVPVYESYQSLSPTTTFSSDDYYALLDPPEGAWPETGAGSSTDSLSMVDLGVGRFPIKTSSDADAIINKITNYTTNHTCLGKWRNQVAIVADNYDLATQIPFETDAETKVVPYIPALYNIDKLYMDAYPLVSTPDGDVCPALTTAIQEEIDKGALIIDYLGHGGETIWAQEDVLNTTLISQWTNLNKLPFFITATCDFGRYDDPAITSGSETLLVLAQGGGIGSLSSTRPVYQGSNDIINTAFVKNIFTPSNKTMPVLGDVMKLTKNQSISGTGNRNYALLGDPSLTLAYPTDLTNIIQINNIAVTASDTIKALEKVTLTGNVRSHLDSSLLTSFTGILYITVFDKPSEVVVSPIPPLVNFYTSDNFLYEGSASVKNGAFTLSFIVPKDIVYNFGHGKISLYAQKEDGTMSDAHGIDTSIIVGGSVSNPTVDVTPPAVKLYMQDTTFVNGGLTSSNTVLIAHLTDASGINVSDEGIGHGITAILDNNTENKINLNSYYSANKDSYTSGSISFPVTGLSAGMHTIQLTVWDTYNNSAVVTIEFEVANSANLAVQNVLNYPNPFTTSTTFHFDQNREGDDLEVLVQIYTASGQLIHTIDEKIPASTAHIATVEWNGRDDFGDKIGKGVYIYKLKARSLRDGSDTFKYQKLVILN